MLQTVVIDIETVIDNTIPQELLNNIYSGIAIKADGRITDPSKIEADIQFKTANAKFELQSSFALSPMTGKICCFGWKVDNGSPVSFASENEAEILTEIATLFADTDQLTTFITFNGKSFDMPFIKVRSAIYSASYISFPRRDTKYDLGSHFDVRSALTNFDTFGKGKLSQWCLRFGLPIPIEHHGGTIQELYNEGNLTRIGEICMSDVEATYSLYQRIKNIYK